jgi:hypothetical protein
VSVKLGCRIINIGCETEKKACEAINGACSPRARAAAPMSTKRKKEKSSFTKDGTCRCCYDKRSKAVDGVLGKAHTKCVHQRGYCIGHEKESDGLQVMDRWMLPGPSRAAAAIEETEPTCARRTLISSSTARSRTASGLKAAIRRRASCRSPRHCRYSTPSSSRDGGVE